MSSKFGKLRGSRAAAFCAVLACVSVVLSAVPAAAQARKRAVLILMRDVSAESFLTAAQDPQWKPLLDGSALALVANLGR